MKERVVIIGSGFGGAISAARLAESGRFEVILLERGARYGRNEFPRRPDELLEGVWQPSMARTGLYEYESFEPARMDVITAAGLGGGSLIYSNVLHEAPDISFRHWPGGYTRARLKPYYDRVLDEMEARPYPIAEPGPYYGILRTRAMQRAAARLWRDPLGKPAVKLELPPLAVRFGPRVEEEAPNREGVLQTTCRLCGECNFGCNTQAKNTLDLNYLARAQRLGCEVRTHAEVIGIEPWEGAGYKVLYRDPRGKNPVETLHANRVILAGGALNSPRLLLRMKRENKLPRLSDALGTRWSSNGDLVGLIRKLEERINPSTGPVITAALRFESGSYPDGTPHVLYLEDGGYPAHWAWYTTIINAEPAGWVEWVKYAIAYGLSRVGLWRRFRASDAANLLYPDAIKYGRTLILFGMGADHADGKLRIEGCGPDEDLQLDWTERNSELHHTRTREAMQRVADALGGEFLDMSYMNRFVTVHPLGGCPMGESSQNGVVSTENGEVFGYPKLYVIDGSVIPAAIGPNPSLTIAAVAEIFAERIVAS
jgi:cholesterol oxidase